ncbi:MAG: fibronectin type III domain-containing protein, partial [Bacteroidales bacterium]
MKKITFLLSALVLSSAIIAQSFIPSWDLEKMQRDKEREAVEFYQQHYDKNPDAVAIPEVPTDAMYDLLFQFPPYDIGGTYAVATDGDYIYTARWNASLFHKLDFQGNLVEEFTIAGAGEIRDLAYDGEYFYGAPNSATIYKMDFVNKVLVGTISGPSAVRGIAYDEINDGFWVTNGWDPPIRLISHTGAVLQTLNTTASSFGGIGWENVTEGGPYLWGYCQSGATDNLLVKINMTTGATIETFELNQSVTIVDGIAGGMEITDKVYPGKWAFFGTSQNDCIWALELADAAPPDAPAAVTNLTATAGANGALTATLNWNNPAVSVNGEPLTELTAVKIYRNDDLIHTINNPVIGGAATYTDNAVPAAGNVAYKLIAENSAGEGIPALVTVWVGPDVPAAPGDVLLVAQGNDGFITWTAPTGGLHGGFYSPEGLNYTVKRFPGSVTVASNITALEYLDNTVPGVGNYYYTVTATNDVGEGGTGTSNTALLGAEGLLIFEQFDSGMPAGWEVLGMGGGNWSIANTANAGGTAPELQFSWTPSFVGVSRFASPNINSGEYSALRLKFNQMLNDFSTFTGEFIAVDCSIDNGATWEQLWFHEASSSLNAQLTEVYFSVPQNTNFRIAFKFDGNSYNINYWYIDNVVVEPVMGQDLSAMAITGNVTPSVGEATNYTVKFQNAGADPVAG